MSPGLLPVGSDHLWWSDTGGEGLPVVLSHAGITDSSAFDGLAELLPDLRLVRWDQRGFGRSPAATSPYTTGADLLAVIDAALARSGASRVHLVGNSMGGEASLAVAVAHPSRVASLTLLCPGIGGYPWPDPTPAEEALYAEYRDHLRAGDVDGLTRLSLGEWCRSGVDDYLRGQLAASVRADLANGDLPAENPPQWEAAASLEVPAAVVAGLLDPPDSLRASRDLAARIPGAELVELPVDHLPQYRDPAAVADVVRRTLARARDRDAKE